MKMIVMINMIKVMMVMMMIAVMTIKGCHDDDDDAVSHDNNAPTTIKP